MTNATVAAFVTAFEAVASIDEGLTWNYITDLKSFVKIREFVIDNDYIFALSDNAIYREQLGSNVFVKIADIDSSAAKDLVIFKNQFYVTTDNGIKKSAFDNIYIDTDIQITATFEQLNLNTGTVPATTVNSFDK